MRASLSSGARSSLLLVRLYACLAARVAFERVEDTSGIDAMDYVGLDDEEATEFEPWSVASNKI